MPLLSRLALLALFLALAGCDDADDPEPVGVDFARLFAAPTPAELEAVRGEWAAREAGGAYDPGAVEVLFDGDYLSDGSRVVVLRHTVGGAGFAHYAAVRFPAGPARGGGWPVLVLNHGGDDGFDLGTYLGYVADPDEAFGALGAEAAVVFPTFRSETMRTGLTALGDLTAGGTESPWDRDVDDALAALDATLATFPDLTDPERIGTLGLSRGGGVSLLMAARDARVDVVTEYFGVTSFFTASVQNYADLLVNGTELDRAIILQLPGIPYLYTEFLRPLAEGDGGITYAAFRLELLKRSAAYFPDRLPDTQAHHHACDLIVPFDQYRALEAEQADIAGATDFNPYGDAADCRPSPLFHSFDPAVMPGNLEATFAFHQAHLLTPGRFAVAP